MMSGAIVLLDEVSPACDRAVQNRLANRSVVLGIKLCIAHGQDYDAINQGNDGRDPCPAKQNTQDALTDLTKIELVDTNATKQQSKQACCHLVVLTLGDSRLPGTGHANTACWTNLCSLINQAATVRTVLRLAGNSYCN